MLLCVVLLNIDVKQNNNIKVFLQTNFQVIFAKHNIPIVSPRIKLGL
jgi:hypothetical protein